LRRAGLDATFSDFKDISLLDALTTNTVDRAKILRVHGVAVHSAREYLAKFVL
jgi:hypothetical protein